MSDTWEQPPAPGWWKASDGNWYPPQPSQPAPPPPPPGGQWPPAGGHAPPGAVYYSPQMSQPQSNGLSTASLVLGILSILGFWTFGIGILFGLIAVVLGVLGRNRSRNQDGGTTGRATGGIITGVLGILGGALFIAMVVAVWPDVVDQIEEDSRDGFCDTANPWDPDC
jgi:hypothetical protein